jgi:hypothetical protein
MRSLPRPDRGPLHYVDRAIATRQTPTPTKQALLEMRGTLASANDSYVTSLAASQVLPSVDLEEARAAVLLRLFDTYSSDGHGSGLRTSVVVNPANPSFRCIYCGIGSAYEIDHFLPSSRYPEHAVNPVNLVPACAKCNRDKSNEAFDRQGVRLPHPYLDDLSRHVWLECEVNRVAGSLTVEYRLNLPSPDRSADSRVSKLFHDLDLLSRFDLQGSIEIGEGLAVFEAYLSGVHSEVTAAVNEDALRHHARFGHNHWKSALYRGLARAVPIRP